MDETVFLPCWLFALRQHPSTGAYSCWVGPGLGAKTQARCLTQGEFIQLNTSQYFHHQCLCPQGEPQLPPSPQETLQDQQVGLAHAPMESLLLPWVLVCTRPCVCPPRVESLFPLVLWSSWNQALLAFNAKCSGGSSSGGQTPRLGSLVWGSELSLLWEKFCDIIILHFVGHPSGWYGIWLHHMCTSPTGLWFLHVFGCRISFFFSFLVDSSLFYQ